MMALYNSILENDGFGYRGAVDFRLRKVINEVHVDDGAIIQSLPFWCKNKPSVNREPKYYLYVQSWLERKISHIPHGKAIMRVAEGIHSAGQKART
jgi:hypothetical protein